MQFLTQLCAKKKETRKGAHEDATARRYWSIHDHELIVDTKEVVDHTTQEHVLFSFNNSGSWVFNNTVKSDDIKLPRDWSKFANFEREYR